jgi:hypothetical protein
MKNSLNTFSAAMRKWLGPLVITILAVLTIRSVQRLAVSGGSAQDLLVVSTTIGALLLALAWRIAHWRYAGAVLAVFGTLCAGGGYWLLQHRSEQIDKYNQAMVALDKHDLPNLVKLLDESSAAYKREATSGYIEQLLFGAPRTDIEARARFHKGVALAQAKKGKEAAEQFWLSLQLNPGNRYIGLSSEDAAIWGNDALQAKYNLEKLYQTGQADGQAKGKGGGPKGQQPSPKPGDDPSNQRGKKDRDTL